MPFTFFVYKMNTKLIKKKAFNALCCPLHVSTLMQKIVDLLVKTSKNLYGKRKKHICWVTVIIKSFLHLNKHWHSHPIGKSRLWYQVCSCGVENDDINNQHANVIQWSNNVESRTKGLKKRRWMNMGLISQYVDWLGYSTNFSFQNINFFL
jgi:hypothetical protein